jgi:hypothetical protein
MNNHTLTLILVLFVFLAGLSILYTQKETFVSATLAPLPIPTSSTVNSNVENTVSFLPNNDVGNIISIIDNININGKYLNVFQLKPFKTENGDVFNPLGQYMTITNGKYNIDWKSIETIPFSLRILARNGVPPLGYSRIWSSKYLEKPVEQDFSIWRPNAPPGYAALCDIVVMGFSEPVSLGVSSITCIPLDIIEASPILKNELLEVKSIENDEKITNEEEKGMENNININFMLKCWNVSTHQFFKCNNMIVDNKDKNKTNLNFTPILFQDEKELKSNIYNIKQSSLNGLK